MSETHLSHKNEDLEMELFLDLIYKDTFSVVYYEKTFVFRKKVAAGFNEKIKDLDPAVQQNMLVAEASVSPKLDYKTVCRLPGEFIGIVALEMQSFLDKRVQDAAIEQQRTLSSSSPKVLTPVSETSPTG